MGFITTKIGSQDDDCNCRAADGACSNNTVFDEVAPWNWTEWGAPPGGWGEE